MFSSANLFLFLNAKHNTLDHPSRFAPTCTTHKEEECLVASYTKPGRVICIVSGLLHWCVMHTRLCYQSIWIMDRLQIHVTIAHSAI